MTHSNGTLDHFDPKRWSVPDDFQFEQFKPSKWKPKRSPSFLKGPIPWPWIRTAVKLPGKALAIGLMLWLESGMKRRKSIHFVLTRAVKIGIPHSTARRAIRELEQARLIRVKRRPGRGINVVLLGSGVKGNR